MIQNKGNNYNMPIPVLLSTERDGTTDTANYEPEFVRVRASNNYYVYLDSSDAYLDTDKTNLRFTNANKPGGTPSPLITRTKRIAITSIHLISEISNVTPRNNVASFHWNGNDYNATVVEGVYTDAAVLMTALTAAMNVAVGSAEFSAALVGAHRIYFNITGATHPFRFTGGTATTRGSTVFGIPVRANLTNPVVVGPVSLEYPSRVFVSSNALTSYIKHPVSTTLNVPGCILEIRPQPGSYLGGTINILNLSWINFEHIASLSLIDMRLVDEFNEPLYVYKPYEETKPLQWGVTLLCEM